MSIEQAPEQLPSNIAHHLADPGQLLALTTVAGAVANYMLGVMPVLLTSGAAFVAIVYYVLQILKDTWVQSVILKWQSKRKTKKIQSLRAKRMVIETKLEALDLVHEAQRVAGEKVKNATASAAEQIRSTPQG